MSAEKNHRAALDTWLDQRLLGIHTSFPAVITSINYSNNTCSVLPLVKTKRTDGSQVPYSEIPDVRLQVMSAKRGKVGITIPSAVGDNVWVFVSERDMALIMEGDGLEPSDSTVTNTHDISDAFAIPCFHPDGNPTEVDNNNIVIRNESTKIVVSENSVEIETTSVSIKAEDIKADCDTFNITASSFNVDSDSFTHNGVNVGDDHKHGAGTYVAGGDAVTNQSGDPV